MVSGQLSILLLDWTTAVVELNITNANILLEKEPELLWTPIPQSLNDIDHLQDHLVDFNKLGTSLQPLSAIQFTLVYYHEGNEDSEDRYKFLLYLIEQSSLHDLDTRFWGECNNTTLHLVCFLGHQKIVQLLIEKGVSVTPSNELGYIPRDITSDPTIIQLLTTAAKTTKPKKTTLDRAKSSALRPNYSTPDRFKLLRELAEESTVIEQQQKKKAITLDRQKSEGHYFRKGRVKETQQKVLTEEEVVELEKQRMKRQLEVAQLVKKSAVKNNPLFKKLEKRSFTSPTPSPSTSTTNLNATADESSTLDGASLADALNKETTVEEEPVIRPKRNSKVISSLQKKSYVSTSIFVQADEVEPKLPPPMVGAVNEDAMFISQEDTRVTQQSLDDDEAQCATTTILSNEPSDIEYEDHYNEKDVHQDQTTDDEDYYELGHDEELIESLGVGQVKIHPEQDLQINTNKVVYPIEHTMTSSDGSDYSDNNDDDDDDEFEEATPVQFATRMVSPVYKSVVLLSEEEKLYHLEEKRQQEASSSPEQRSPVAITNIENQIESSSSININEIVNNQQYNNSNSNISLSTTKSDRPANPRSSSLLSIKTENLSPPPQQTAPELVTTTPVRPQRSELRRGSNNNVNTIKQFENESKEKKRMSGSQKAAWTMSMSSWAAILDKEFNLDELDQEKKLKQQQQQKQLQEQIIEESHTTSRPSFDYLGGSSDSSSKYQLSEDEIEVIFQGSLSRTSLSPTSPLSSTLQLKSFDPPPPQSPPRRQPPSIATTPLPRAPQIETAFPRLQNQKSVSRKPIAASISESTMRSSVISTMPTKQQQKPAPPSINIKHRGDYGKLYLHVNDISDILLPLPKERAYVRCVVSDGRFEYMSRYEILSQNINFDYECVIDTHPDMIITISLHVRPDYVMKSRKPFSRLFSSKKKKESLSGYVNKEDGAIGQARFALAHMLPVCMETTYLAGFHCFNAWYSRSFKERHRQKKQDPDQDVLKVVGNFDVEMFYLPVQDYNKPFPRNLRECDMAIKQLHQSVRDSSEKYHTF